MRQRVALLTAVVLFAVFFGSSVFLFTHLSHDCTGRNCKVCGEIEVCIQAISVISEAIGTAAAVTVLYQIIKYTTVPYRAGRFLCPLSLVDLKIRMDN